MSAVYDTLKKDRLLRQQAMGFATMRGDPIETSGAVDDYASTVSQTFVGSAFVASAAPVYALGIQGARQWYTPGVDEADKLLTIAGVYRVPIRGPTEATTMALGGVWVISDPVEDREIGVVRLAWPRRVIHSERIRIRIAQLPRRRPRTIISDAHLGEENA